MKTTFFAAAIVALLSGAEATLLMNNEQIEIEDWLAQTDISGEGNTNT